MGGKFIDDDAVGTSSTSSLTSPPGGRFIEDDVTNNDVTGGKFLDDESQPIDHDALTRRFSDIAYTPTLEEFKRWHEGEEAKPFRLGDKLQIAADAAEGLAGMVGRGIKGVGKMFTDPENNDPIVTGVEALARGARQEGILAAKLLPSNLIGKYYEPSFESFREQKVVQMNREKFPGGFTPETFPKRIKSQDLPKATVEKLQKEFKEEFLPKERYQRYLSKRADILKEAQIAQSKNSVLTGQPAPFNVEAAEAGSLVASPVNIATLGIAATPKVGATILQRGAGAALAGAGKAVTRGGKFLEDVAGLPAKAVGKIAEVVTENPEASAKAAGVVETGATGVPGVRIPFVSAIDKLKWAVKPITAAGETLQGAGRQMAEAPSRRGMLSRMATDGANPVWLRKASGIAASVPLVKTTMELSGQALESAAHGAAIGGVLGGLAEGEEGFFSGVGAGSVMGAPAGVVGRLIARDAVLATKRQGDLNRWIESKSPEELANIAQMQLSPGAALSMATLETYAKGVRGIEGEADVRFMYVREAEFQKSFGGSAKGAELVAGDQPTIVINVDKADSRTLPHEVMHGLMDLSGTPEAKAALQSKLFSQWDPTTGQVLSDGIFSRADQDAAFDQYYKRLPAIAKAEWDSLPIEAKQAKIRGEIVADAFSNLVSSNNPDMVATGLTGVRRRMADSLIAAEAGTMLAGMRKGLEAVGVEFKSSGAPSELFVRDGKPITNSPQVDAALRDYLRAKGKVVTRLSADEDSPFATVVSRQDMMSKNGKAIAELFKDNDTFKKDRAGNVVFQGNQPVLLSEGLIRKLQTDRAQRMMDALAKVPDAGEVGAMRRKENGAWEGRFFSDAQLAALDAISPDILPPSLKVKLRQKNEYHKADDGNRYVIDYNAATKEKRGGGRIYSSAIKSTLRDVVPISMHISKAGNFYTTALDTTVLFSKLERWLKDKPKAFESWQGDRDAFVRDLFKYLDNHANGRSGSIDLDPTPWRAVKKKDVINDLLGVARGTGANPLDMSTKAGKDQLIRSFRFDRTNRITPSGGDKMPFDYYKAKANFLPEGSERKIAEIDLFANRFNFDISPSHGFGDSTAKAKRRFPGISNSHAAEAGNALQALNNAKQFLTSKSSYQLGVKTANESMRMLKQMLKISGEVKGKGGFVELTKQTKTPYGSRYYDLDYEGQWWKVRVADHANRADRAGIDDVSFAGGRTASGMDYPHQLNIVLESPAKSDAQAFALAKQAIKELPWLTKEYAGKGWIDIHAKDGVFSYEFPHEIENALGAKTSGNTSRLNETLKSANQSSSHPTQHDQAVAGSEVPGKSSGTKPQLKQTVNPNFLPLREAEAVAADALHNIQLHRDFLADQSIRKTPAQIKQSEIAIKGYQKTLVQASRQRLKALVGMRSTASRINFLPEGPDGPDILNVIEELGGIAGPGNSKFRDKGDYDGYAEAFGYGPARALRRANSRNKPDDLRDQLVNYGFRGLETTSDLYAAVDAASERRMKYDKTLLADHELQSAFLDAALTKEKNRQSIPSNILEKGDQFTVAGERVTVKGIDTDLGEIHVHAGKYGVQMLPPETYIFAEPNTFKKASEIAPAAIPEPVPTPIPAPEVPVAKPEIKVRWKTLAEVPEVKPPPKPSPEVIAHQRAQAVIDTARRMARQQRTAKLTERIRIQLSRDYFQALDKTLNKNSTRLRSQQIALVAHAVASTPQEQLDAIVTAHFSKGANGSAEEIKRQAMMLGVLRNQ